MILCVWDLLGTCLTTGGGIASQLSQLLRQRRRFRHRHLAGEVLAHRDSGLAVSLFSILQKRDWRWLAGTLERDDLVGPEAGEDHFKQCPRVRRVGIAHNRDLFRAADGELERDE